MTANVFSDDVIKAEASGNERAYFEAVRPGQAVRHDRGVLP